MVNIFVVCVGKLKEKYWTEAVAEYSRRLGSYCRLEIVELKESRLPDRAGAAEEEAVKEAMLANNFEILEIHHMKDWVSITAKPKK